LTGLLLIVSLACGRSDPLERVKQAQDVRGDFKSTIEPLRELIDKRPDDPEVHYRYAIALEQTGDRYLAIWPLKRAMEYPGWLKKAGLPLVALLISSGAHGEAIAVCDRILEAEPDDVPTLLARATGRMLSRRDYKGSLADAERVLELDPENTDALVPRTVALLALNRIEEASTAIEKLEALYRDDSLGLHGNATLCAARATFAKEKGDAIAAAERFESCVKDFPIEPLIISGAVEFFDGIERPERSNEILSQALEQSAGSYELRSTLALRLVAQGKDDEAEALLRKGTERPTPGEAAEAWAGLGSFLVDRDRLDDALAAFEKARALDSSRSPQLTLAYADALVLAGRYDDALAIADKMDLPAHQAMTRARVALAQGKPGEALRLYENGMRLWPNNAVARYYAGVAAEQLGAFDRAVEYYRYAMRIDDSETDAYLRLARLHAAAGRDREALDSLQFSPGGRPDEVAAALLQTRLLARQGKAGATPGYVRALLKQPALLGAGVAAMGEGVRERSGAEAALKAMRAVKIDLQDPLHVEALAAIVEDLAATGKAKQALGLVDAGLRAHPDAAEFHALRGRALVLSGGQVVAARAAFERALELDAKSARALLGLARLEVAAGASDQALALFDRARAADPESSAPVREAAAVLVALGRRGDAETKLSDLLRDQPTDGEAARSLAELRLARGTNDERTLDLARRAVAFGGGAEAKALLERVTERAQAPGAEPRSGGKTG
jgi:tetratricopeptide (TPR) repeat protein